MRLPSRKRIIPVFLAVICLAACILPSATDPTSAPTRAPESPPAAATPTPSTGPTPTVEEFAPTFTPASPQTTPAEQLVLPDGPITLLTLGDSLTEGAGDENGTGYPGRLLEMLQTLRPGTTLFNYGISGWNSDYLINGGDGLPSQLEPALAVAQTAHAAGLPVLALVWIGNNDLWYLYEYGPDPITAEAESVDLDNYTRNLTQIITELQNAGAVVLIGLNDDQSLRPFLTFPGDPVLPYTTPDDREHMSAQIQAYNTVIQSLAGEFGAGVVDFFNTDIFTNPETMAEDGIHPNAHGYDLVAEIWMEAILKMMP